MTDVKKTTSRYDHGGYRDFEHKSSWYAEKWDELAHKNIRPPLGRFNGKGIVTSGGGEYFPGAYALIKLLRKMGCYLPIELWYMGEDELSTQAQELLVNYNVRCRNAAPILERFDDAADKGWLLCPIALVYSDFREVLWLDSDSYPTRNPEFLFESPDYQRYGALFWPDKDIKKYAPVSKPPKGIMYDICDVPYDKFCMESGQIVLDKVRVWKPLMLSLWINRHSKFFYQYIFGDKDSFYFAWRKCNRQWGGPLRNRSKDGIIQQYDLNGASGGQVLFQHRIHQKLNYDPAPVPSCHHDEFLRDCVKEIVNHPILGRPQITDRKRVIVTGIPKTGQTFMAWIISQMPEVQITDELDLYTPMPADRVASRLKIQEQSFTRLNHVGEISLLPDELLEELPHYPYDILQQKFRNFGNDGELIERIEQFIWQNRYRVVGDKSPRYLPHLPDILHKKNIDLVVITLRDPWDILVSWMKPREGGKPFAEPYMGTDNLERVTQNLIKSLQTCLDAVEVLCNSDSAVIAPHWLWGQTRGSQMLDTIAERLKCESSQARSMLDKKYCAPEDDIKHEIAQALKAKDEDLKDTIDDYARRIEEIGEKSWQ